MYWKKKGGAGTIRSSKWILGKYFSKVCHHNFLLKILYIQNECGALLATVSKENSNIRITNQLLSSV